MPELLIYADGGGTKTIACATRLADGASFEAMLGPCVPTLDFAGAVRCIDVLISQFEVSCGRSIPADDIVIMLSSAGLDVDDVRRRFEAELRERCVDSKLVSDGESALIGCVGEGDGAVICLGTGVVAYSRFSGAQPKIIDAWGWPAGDLGGGAYLGRRLAEEFLHAVDAGTIAKDNLLRLAEAEIGSERTEIYAWLERANRQSFANLTKLIVQAAVDGSRLGRLLLSEAGDRLSSIASILINSGHSVVHLTGGLAESLAPYIDCESLRIVPNASLAGAQHLATQWLDQFNRSERFLAVQR